jgi:hypothetical protein
MWVESSRLTAAPKQKRPGDLKDKNKQLKRNKYPNDLSLYF